jgi:hypothetical protein
VHTLAPSIVSSCRFRESRSRLARALDGTMAMFLALSSTGIAPVRPALKPPALPVKLAGGLFLFATSVPKERKAVCENLQSLAERALRTDPRITMELGMGIEAGGIFASASSGDACVINFQYALHLNSIPVVTVLLLPLLLPPLCCCRSCCSWLLAPGSSCCLHAVLLCTRPRARISTSRINGGNAWAECTAFGALRDGGMELLDVTVANMDAAMTGTASLQVTLPQQGKSSNDATLQEDQMAKAMAAARAEAGIDVGADELEDGAAAAEKS